MLKFVIIKLESLKINKIVEVLSLAGGKRRKSKEEEQTYAGIATSILAGFGIYYYSHSWVAAVAVGAVFLIVWVALVVTSGTKRRERLKYSGIKEIDRMDGRQFEEYLGELFQFQGYEVQITQASHDYGADIILRKDGVKSVVQAKRYSTNVGLEAVQQAYSAINYYEATEAWAVTNFYFTDPAKNLAQANQVRLIERDELIEMILLMKQSLGLSPRALIRAVQPAKAVTAAAAEPLSLSGALNPDKTYEAGPPCPKCGQATYLRNTSKGKAYVCVNVPACTFYKVV